MSMYLQDTAGDVRGYLRVRRVFCAFSLRSQVMFKTRLPQGHKGRAVSLDGASLPDGCGDACDADLDDSLIIVIG